MSWLLEIEIKEGVQVTNVTRCPPWATMVEKPPVGASSQQPAIEPSDKHGPCQHLTATKQELSS